MKPLLRLLTELSSRKFISTLAGTFAKSKWSRKLITKFASTYRIPVEEAEKAIAEYTSLNEFFTRRLKPGLRLVDMDPATLTSPVDALITGMGEIHAGGTMQVKGQEYTVEELLNHSPRTVNYSNGYFIVLYLSPQDYHRIHAPVSGTIVEKEHIPGRVYPVNDFAIRNLKKVLSRNERLATYIQHSGGEVAVVKVGALNVSSIRYIEPLPDQLEKGAELAYFEFGSTVVLLMESGTFKPSEAIKEGKRVRMGEAIGTLRKKHQTS